MSIAKSAEPLQSVLNIVPEWSHLCDLIATNRAADSGTAFSDGQIVGPGDDVFKLFQCAGAHSIYKATINTDESAELIKYIRDFYLFVLANKMFKNNSTLRRFFSERRIPQDEQKSQIISLAYDLVGKLYSLLKKNLANKEPSGFKVLLPAYIQSTVNNATIDYIKAESKWERQTQKVGVESDDETELVETIAGNPDQVPDQVIISNEKVRYLNQLRVHLQSLLSVERKNDQSLLVIDCIFGLGLTKHSQVGEELTMRECCERLKIDGETQARKIARCQVLLDKGLDSIRKLLREQLPGIVDCWQKEVNINTASRRDLNHQLDLSEGESDRLIANRQYVQLAQLVERLVVKNEKLPSLVEKGAVAAFVPVDLNSATVRDMIDIVGLSKEEAQTVAQRRPFQDFSQIEMGKYLSKERIEVAQRRGAVLKCGK